MGTIYYRGNRIWMGFQLDGKQRCRSTGFMRGEEKQARKLLRRTECNISSGIEFGDSVGTVTVASYAKIWTKARRARGLRNVTTDEGRVTNHILPCIGRLKIDDVRPRHLKKLVAELRAKGLAPRTVHNIYGLVRKLFRDAQVDELVDTNPCVLTSTELGRKEDKDPEWRSGAVFSRDEVELFISSDLIPCDRQVIYALLGLAGLRHGEMAGMRWRHYDAVAEPLGRLVVACSYLRPGTKTGRTREVPVHPTLAAMLAEWKLGGWVEMMGRQPCADDLIAPSRRGNVRSRHRSYDALQDDLRRHGLRPRRQHDFRRAFITLARVDGARADILEHVTHAPRGDIVNIYTTLPWLALCAEVAKLNVERKTGTVLVLPATPKLDTVDGSAIDGAADLEAVPSDVGRPEAAAEVSPTTRRRSRRAGKAGASTTVLLQSAASPPADPSKLWDLRQKLEQQLVEPPGIELGVHGISNNPTSRVFSPKPSASARFSPASESSRVPPCPFRLSSVVETFWRRRSNKLEARQRFLLRTLSSPCFGTSTRRLRGPLVSIRAEYAKQEESSRVDRVVA